MKEFQKVTQEKILKNQKKKQENKENSKNILIEI